MKGGIIIRQKLPCPQVTFSLGLTLNLQHLSLTKQALQIRCQNRLTCLRDLRLETKRPQHLLNSLLITTVQTVGKRHILGVGARKSKDARKGKNCKEVDVTKSVQHIRMVSKSFAMTSVRSDGSKEEQMI